MTQGSYILVPLSSPHLASTKRITRMVTQRHELMAQLYASPIKGYDRHDDVQDQLT